MTVVQLVDCPAVELAMEKEAVATPMYFQQVDLEGQAALENLSWCLAYGTHSLPARRRFIHTVGRSMMIVSGTFALNIFVTPYACRL